VITVDAIYWPRAKVTNQMQRKARELRAMGRTFREIADELGVEKSAVARWTRHEHGSASGAPEPRRQPVARREGRL
jgi:orotate phosphoribosyltransferase-like protein